MPSQLISLKDSRKDFPIFNQERVYLDSAATAQKPLPVIKAMEKFAFETNANVHRAVYDWSAQATMLYEQSRKKIAQFINAKHWETVFVRNATEAINLVSYSWGDANLKKGDRILVTEMEHHSNLVPWQQLAKRTGAILEHVPITKEGVLDLNKARELLNKKPKILAVNHVSNCLGTINPVSELIALARQNKTKVLVDACQSVQHMPVNVKKLDCDFLVFSGHKLFGPTGIGVLYAKEELLQDMQPFLTGGEMIKEVTPNNASWNDIPWKFEAGTPAIAEAIALGVAVDYLSSIGMRVIEQHDQELTKYAFEKLKNVPGITIYGPGPDNRCGVISFNLADVHAHDLASVLDEHKVAIRSGHHCCMPLMNALGVPATARLSIALYNTKEDIDALVKALGEARKVFKL